MIRTPVDEGAGVDVSVVLAVKDESKHIREALESILGQTEVDLEVIVVDDSSGDDTLDIMQRLSTGQPRLRVFRNPRVGKVSAYNYGVEQVRGRFVCLFSGDDVMPPASLARRLDVVRGVPDSEPVMGLSKIMTLSDIPKFHGHVVPRAKGRGNPSGQSPLMSRHVVQRLFPIPEDLPNEDTWIELALAFLPDLGVIHSDVISCHWRMHEGNSYNMTLPFRRFKDAIVRRQRAVYAFSERYDDELPPDSKRRLQAKIRCVRAHERGSIIGIMMSGADLMTKGRALSSVNAPLYGVRRGLFGLLSGW